MSDLKSLRVSGNKPCKKGVLVRLVSELDLTQVRILNFVWFAALDEMWAHNVGICLLLSITSIEWGLWARIISGHKQQLVEEVYHQRAH